MRTNRQRDFVTNAGKGPVFDQVGGLNVIGSSGASTYTTPEFVGRMILRDPNGGAVSDVTPTAAALIALDPAAQVGDSYEVTIRNTANASETITLTGGVGVTVVGTATIAQSNQKTFLVVKTSETTISAYSMGTVVF